MVLKSKYIEYNWVLITVFLASQCSQKARLLNIAEVSSPSSPFLWHLKGLKRQVY